MSGKARLIVGVGMLMVLWLLGPVADVRADQLPDLTVSLDAPRGVALAGETFSVMATIQNIGNAAAPGSTVRYSLEGVVLLNQTLPPLAARGKISAAAGLPIPAGAAPGTYRLVAEVDPSGLIQERRENNNTAATTLTISTPLVEWVLADGTVVSARSGALGLTGVTVEVRGTPTAHGKRYDVRLRNRTGTDYSHTALRVRLPRAGTATAATIEGLTVPVPAEVHQGWEPSALAGTQYGFAYAITSGATVLRRVGPSTVESQWGGRTAGLVRIDGNAYLVPEFWERQPRRITVTATEVVLTLFEGAEPLRAGEDAWDRFATLDAALADATALAETDALPTLPAAERQALMARFGIAPEGLPGLDPEAEAALRQYDRWQGTSWDKAYATDNPQTAWPGEENSTKTTLFSLLRRGLYYPVTDPKTYAWRDYGDIQWAEGMSAGHYDWVRAALKHYLKTGNLEALHWGMAAVRSAVSVDHAWASPTTPALDNWLNLAGLARYEKGDHGGVEFVARPTHSWLEGLFLAAALTGDPWVRETAVDMAEGLWRFWGGSTPVFHNEAPASWAQLGGEVRIMGWPLLGMVVAFRETGDPKYWTKASELMDALYDEEGVWGRKGYIADRSVWSSPYNAYPFLHAYTTRGMLAFADAAIARGEWPPEYEAFLQRMGTWLTTPVPNGPYYPPTLTSPGALAFYWCPPDLPPGYACPIPTSNPQVAHNPLMVDLLAWLASRDPATWTLIARQVFEDYVYHSAHRDPAIVGFLTDVYPAAEPKILGWMQLFGDRAARWLAAP